MFERKRVEYRPVNEDYLEEARQRRMKEVRMWEIIYDLGSFFFFIWILLVLSHGNRDPNAFLMRNELGNNFLMRDMDPEEKGTNIFSIGTIEDLYTWLRDIFIEDIIFDKNYNDKYNRKLDTKWLIKDQVSLLLGYSTLRQIRIENETCQMPEVAETFVRHKCRSKTNLIYEEKENFDVGWKPLPAKKRPKEEYTYKGSLELQGIPFWGNRDVYSGGGYQVKLRGNKGKLLSIIDRLEANRWLDERTRALFVEFSLFNVQVNLFASCIICFEQGPEGSLTVYAKLNPLKLLRYSEGFALFVMICEGLFIAFIVYYTYSEIRDMIRQGKRYWKDSWNYLEIIIIGLGWSATVFYAIRTVFGIYIANKFKETEGNGYIKLDYAASVDEVCLYLFSFLVFFANLKFIKLLRFNKRMGVLTSTLKQCAADLSGFMVAFLLSFLSFSMLFFFMHKQHHLEYSTFISAIESSLSIMLGKFDFSELVTNAPLMAPMAFFIFVFFTSIVMVNLLLTIILTSFMEVKNDLLKQSNEYEILDFLVYTVKKTVGLGGAATGDTNVPIPDTNKDS
ncbi:hypothetical protein SK128_013346, partial [Halocaridina rubra]